MYGIKVKLTRTKWEPLREKILKHWFIGDPDLIFHKSLSDDIVIVFSFKSDVEADVKLVIDWIKNC